MDTVTNEAEHALYEAIRRHGSVGDPRRLVGAALARAGRSEVPTTNAEMAQFVRLHVMPLLSARLPSVQHGAARAAFARVAAILGQAKAPPAPAEAEEEAKTTERLVARRFDEIFVLTSDEAVVAALAPFRAEGARLQQIGSGEHLARAISLAHGTVLVVLDVRTNVRVLRDALTSARPAKGRMTVVVWGDTAALEATRASLPGVTVARVPPEASPEDLRAVARLGAA